MKKTLQIILLLGIGVVFITCQDDRSSEIVEIVEENSSGLTKSVPTPPLDWENIDWMPTPSGQASIPSPWVGQGSLTSTVGIDVINDRKSADGWELLYNTFDANAEQLINPYFILYNKYRGLMRVYFYVTTPFVTYSSYVQDGISIISNQQTSILNFLGQDVVDGSLKTNNYMQVQSTPYDGSYPLASNKWYMLQYELAYDPNLSSIPYDQIQLNFVLSYCNISSVTIAGTQNGKLYGTIGTTGSNNILSELFNLGSGTGKVALASLGKSFLDYNKLDASGTNRLGIPKEIFKNISLGISTAISNGASSLPGLGISILSALFGGSSTSYPVSLNINMKTDIKLEGTATDNGSFPSMPISHWIPGTSISSGAVGFIPYYNKILGVFNIDGKPDVNLHLHTKTRYIPDEPFDPNNTVIYVESTITSVEEIDVSSHIIINPEVRNIADVTIVDQELLIVEGFFSYGYPPEENIRLIPFYYEYDGRGVASSNTLRWPLGEIDLDELAVAVKVTIRVVPKNGAPPSTIIKTFKLNHLFTYTDEYVDGWG
jgi:hypothetical protein